MPAMFAPAWGGALPFHDSAKKKKFSGSDGRASAQGKSQAAARAAVLAKARARPATGDVVMATAVSASSLPGVRALTYCVKQRKKTANVGGHVATISVKGKTRYQLKSTCSECGCKKCSFLSAAKTGGRLRK